jgi:hypothetical protein
MINLGFLSEGKFAAIFITPFSWGSQRAGHLPRINDIFWRHCRGLEKKKLPRQLGTSIFSGTVAGEEVEDFCEGSFLHTHPLLYYCFALLYLFLPASFFSKNPKKLESLVVVFTYLLLVLLKWLILKTPSCVTLLV